MAESYFITGTDTEIGKTVATIALLQALQNQGGVAIGYKPVATGSEVTPVGLRNRDALILRRNSSQFLPYVEVNPYAFSEPTSPHIASVVEGRPIEFSRLTLGLRKLEQQAEWVLTEGAGGWFTPLTQTQTFADWVRQERLAVIVVVGIKLGCINHAMLTVQAVRQADLRLAGWIANNFTAPGQRHVDYLSTLKWILDVPFLGEIPWLSIGIKIEETKIGQYIDHTALRSIFSKNKPFL